MSDTESNAELSLCSLMLRLKLDNPDMTKIDVHRAVIAEGPQWEDITLDAIDRRWKKMKKRSAKNKKKESEGTQEGATSLLLGQAEGSSLGSQSKTDSKKSKDNACGKQTSSTSLINNNIDTITLTKEVTEKVVSMLMANRSVVNSGTGVSSSSKGPALQKQLKILKEAPGISYVLFTPPDEPADTAIRLSDAMGDVFFKVMWNRAIKSPGSDKIKTELWMIYQQLQGSLSPPSKKLLRKQLKEEFGLDPFEGKP